jgi:hypothetical protein
MKITFRREHCKELRILLISVSCMILFSSLQAQVFGPEEESVTKKAAPLLRERFFYGGSLGLQLGSITDIQFSPVLGFWITPRLGVAAGPDYRYYKDPYARTVIFGGSVYTQFIVIQDLNNLIPLGMHYGFFAMVEDELLSLQTSFWKYPPYTSDRFFINTPLAGGGIKQPLGRKASLDLMVLWPLKTPDYDIYGNPVVRISIIF